MNYTAYDTLYCGFYVDETHVTLYEADAAMLSKDELDALTLKLGDRRIMSRQYEPIKESHPCACFLRVGTHEFVEIFEGEASKPSLIIKNSRNHAMLKELDLITSERDIGTRSYYEFCSQSHGRVMMELCHSEDDAFSKAKIAAHKQLTRDGWHSPYLMSAYVALCDEVGRPRGTTYSLEQALDSNPRHQLKKNTHDVGDLFEFKTPSELAYFRRCTLRKLITKYRFSVPRLSGYGVATRRQSGKLTAEQKKNIIDAMTIIDCADRIEVAGSKVMSSYQMRPTGPAFLDSGNTYTKYQLLFRATVDGRRVCVLVD